MPRTTAALVQGVLVNDWDGVTDLTPYIATANSIVNQVVKLSAYKRTPLAQGLTNDPTTQELIERWLAAHCYTKMDPVYQSKSTLGASASFVRGKNEPEPYKDMAIGVDYSGCLKALLERQFATMFQAGSVDGGGNYASSVGCW